MEKILNVTVSLQLCNAEIDGQKIEYFDAVALVPDPHTPSYKHKIKFSVKKDSKELLKYIYAETKN